MYRSILLLALAALASCTAQEQKNQQPDIPKGDEVVNMAIEAHGGKKYDQSRISFDFRGKHYTAERDNGRFLLGQSYTDTTGEVDKAVVQVLSNDGFEVTIDGEPVTLDPRMHAIQSASVNSVHYFMILPFGLNDPAVNKEYLGEIQVKGIACDKVRVTFDQQGGGTDFEDVFLYWFDADSHELKYLAYEYHVNGGGIRFREAINQRRVGGILFNDYVNYKVDPASQSLAVSDSLFEQGALEELSRIISENVQVESL